ncbi:acyl-protein thioesterase 1 [Eurytemora carolleeae]|uniref:acyl-protein thioesterase 1 n=1 Tax=Eurytemora carolleeae TaxID=1294199 RepID=UPI000C77F0C7|nr:acyl-protein thioesterase 1 [Eurytemora carolleeae]|eukprot:XP_023326169.1 acyl-protein thioesterase 1-like [Eurytemora affinis]
MSMRPVILKPRIKQTATMIFLHGLGDTGHGWAGILNTLRPDHLKVICPTAPVIPITLNLGFRMPAWFDLESLDNLEQETDIEGLKKSAKTVYGLIEDEIRSGIPSNKIIIGGFSQGAVLALYSALHCEKPLAACIALSTFFPEARLPDPNLLYNKGKHKNLTIVRPFY